MGRKARQREEEQLKRDQEISAKLTRHTSQAKNKHDPLTWDKVIFDEIKEYRDYWVNDPSTWVNIRKTKNMDTLRLDLVRHVFGVYKCPIFIENVWLPEPVSHYGNRTGQEKKNRHSKFIPWYFTVAQGGSLYKEWTKGILSKKETHAFLFAPKKYNVVQNIWWARAFCESDSNLGVANRIAQSNLINKDMSSEFWISIMRFFVRYPTPIHEMNDLMDYFVFARQESEHYTVKGRSLEAVRKSCEEWHRFLNKQKSIGGGVWKGSPIENWRHSTGKDEHKIIWRITQIKSGNDLLKEGQKMRHCVVSYKHKCMRGSSSIWSLTAQDRFDMNKRCLTIELNDRGSIVQARGLANRMPKPQERDILNKWCAENGLSYRYNY